MRQILLAAVTTLTAAASVASANFQFSNTRQPFSVTEGSTTRQYERITFYAYNDGTGYSLGGTKLQGIEMTVTSTSAMRFEVADVDGDEVDDISITAPRSAIAARNRNHTKIIGELFSQTMFDTLPNNPAPENLSTASYDAVAAYADRKSFYAVGVALGSSAAVPATPQPGAAFMTVVTTPGATISLVGGIGGETGTAGGLLISGADEGRPFTGGSASLMAGLTPFSYVAAVPEPASLTVVAAASLLLRRRRRAR